MSVSLKGVGAITLFVEDLERTRSFYAQAFDARLIHEDDDSAVFDFGNTLVNLLRAPAAHALIEPAAVADGDAGSRFQLTIWVDDADAACTQLEGRGVSLLNGPQDRDWGMRTAAFADPAGHVWEIAQNLSPQ
jgi:lactoylglutathione lyase